MNNFFTPRGAIACFFLISLVLSNNLATQAQSTLYGLTQNGGIFNQGVAYQINTSGSDFLPFGHFDGNNGGKPGNGSGFIQTTLLNNLSGSIAAMTASGDQYQNWGMRVDVRPGQGGLVPPFRFQFSEGGTGTNPGGRFLHASNGMMYGLTSAKGEFNGGSLFSAPVFGGSGPQRTVSFSGADNGRSPKGSLIQGANGTLYGMTELGGTSDMGVIFSYNIIGGNFTKLLDFNGAERGANPTGNLLFASDGKLYGMTRSGGSSGNGVIFRINTDGTGFTKLMDFNSVITGSAPTGSLIQFTDGKLYGLTSSGGANGFGTIFNLTFAGIFTKVLDFDGTNGKFPMGDLLTSTAGNVMYGVAYAGGANDKGVLFKLENGTQFAKLYDYTQATGSNPVGALMMARKLPQINFLEIAQKTTLDEPFTPVVQTSSALPVYFTSSDPSVAVIENNQVKIVGSGGVFITAYQLGNHEYLPVSAVGHLSVVKAEQTIDFPPIPAKIYGAAPFTLTATASSGLPVIFSTFYNDVISYNGTAFTIIGAGKISIRAIQEGNALYNSVVMERELVVDRAEQTINFSPLPERTCCQSFGLSASSSAGIDVRFKTPDWEKLEVNEDLATIHGLGTATIIAYNEGNRNYKPAEKQAIVNILKSFQTINFIIPNGTFKLGDADVYVQNGTTSGLPITFTSNPAGIAVVEGSYLKFIGVGTTTITASQNGTPLVNAAIPVARTVTVNPPQTPGTGNAITWNDFGGRTTLDPPFNLSARASSGLPVSYTSSNSAVAEISGNLITIKGAGSTTITARQAGNGTIPAAVSVQKVLQVGKQSQYIYFPWMSTVSFGASPIQMPSRSSGQLPLTYTSSNEAAAYVDSDYLLHITSSGRVTITASQAGDENYFPASPASTELNILALYQSIAFNVIPEKTFGDAPFTLAASASSGLPVTFSSNNASIASIDGSTVTINGAGTVSITATQSGFPGFGYVTVTRQLVIGKANQVITFPELPQKKFSDDPFTISATSSAGLPVTFSSSNPSIAKVSANKVNINGTGAIDIIATQTGDQNYKAAEVRRTLEINDAGVTHAILGTTYAGGPNTSGTIFSMNSDGGDYTLLKQFAPRTVPFPGGGFIKGTDGKMYGNFSWGGAHNGGRMVRLEADGSGLAILHDYDYAQGASPMANVIQGSDGGLYAMTPSGGLHGGGSVVSVNTDGDGFAVLHHFASLEGITPRGGLVEASNGKLYGTTQNGGFYGYGSIFSMNKDGSGFTVIYRFNDSAPFKSGFNPRGNLVQGADGYLYGTLAAGGDNGKGILFKIMTDGSGFTKLVKFDGTAKGATPGSTPLIASDGKIYGTTQAGGIGGQGVVYSVNTDGSNFARLFDFTGASTGANALSALIEGSDGLLYGMTNGGGANSLGTIFRINKNGAGFQKLADLDSRASSPYFGPLLEATPGNFFGMTFNGGATNGGAIFSITSDGAFTVIKDFPQEESNPNTLVSDDTGEFYYGIALAGGVSGYGSIFRISEAGQYREILELPAWVHVSQLYYMSTGHIWCLGSQNGQRLVFRIKSDGSEYEPLSEITNNISTDVEWLAETMDGKVIGITTRNAGIFFSVDNDGTGFTEIATMPQGKEFSRNSYFYASDDNIYVLTAYSHEFYQLTRAGAVTNLITLPDEIGQVPMKVIEMNGGSIGIIMRDKAIFSIEKDGSSYAKIFTQSSENGTSPEDMVQTFDGWIYVAASYGGANEKGVIYKIRGDGTSYTKVHEYNGQDGDQPNTIIFKRQEQLITFDPIPAKSISDASFVPHATASSGARIKFKSSNPSVAAIEDGKVKIIGTGTAIITASVPANANYFKAPDVQRELVVEKSGQTIAFSNPGDRVLNNTPFQLHATSTSGLPVSFSTTSDKISINGSTVTILKTGETFVDATQVGNEQFAAAPMATNTFCINPPKPVITASGTMPNVILTSSNNTGNQWYFNNEILDGSTEKNLGVTADGFYTVITTADVCVSDTSTAYAYMVTAVDTDPEISVKAFPNPAREEVYVELTGNFTRKINIELIDGMGRTVGTKEMSGKGTVTFNVRKEGPGMYLVKVTSGKKVTIRKLIKH